MRFSKLAIAIARHKRGFKLSNWFGFAKGHPVCVRCDRAGYQHVKTDTGIEWRCDWHVTEQIPKVVLLQDFDCRRLA